MKICAICNQTYADDNLNYCLNDGGTLTSYNDDAPPTVMFERAWTTQQNWNNYQQPAPWQNQPLQPFQNQQPTPPNQSFFPSHAQGQNQTLPTIALALGIFSMLFACCYGGIPVGAAALIVGFLGLRNINENPMEFAGRGLAIGGIVTGLIGLLISLGLFLLVIISS
jgi:hypothetical protein